MSYVNPPLGAKRWEQMVDDLKEYYFECKDRIKKELLADGYPPFTAPLDERGEFEKLQVMQAMGDPRFLMNPRAEARLNELALKYGPPPDRGQLLAALALNHDRGLPPGPEQA